MSRPGDTQTQLTYFHRKRVIRTHLLHIFFPSSSHLLHIFFTSSLSSGTTVSLFYRDLGARWLVAARRQPVVETEERVERKASDTVFSVCRAPKPLPNYLFWKGLGMQWCTPPHSALGRVQWACVEGDNVRSAIKAIGVKRVTGGHPVCTSPLARPWARPTVQDATAAWRCVRQCFGVWYVCGTTGTSTNFYVL